jgi:hypothetical protein
LLTSLACFALCDRSARPAAAYAFIRHLVYTKTQALLAAATARGVPASHCLPDVTPDNAATSPVGAGFSAWLDSNTVEYGVVVVGAGMAGEGALESGWTWDLALGALVLQKQS